MGPPKRLVFYGWRVVIGAFLIIFFGYGSFYTLPVFYPTLVQFFGWSRAEVALSGGLALLVTGLSSPLVGALVDKRGARFTMVVGTVLVSGSLVAISRVGSLPQFYFVAAVFGLGLAGLSILPAQILVAKWFVARRGLATGIVIAGMGLGGTAGPVVVAAALPSYGWQTTFAAQGLIILVIALPLGLWLIREDPDSVGLRPLVSSTPTPLQSQSPVSAMAAHFTAREAVRTSAFWFLSLSTFFGMFAAIAIIQHLVLYLRGLEFELGSASRILSVLLFSSVLGRVLLGALSDRLTRKVTLLIAYVILGIGSATLFLAQSQAQFLGMAALVGLGYGGSIVLLALTTAETFGVRSVGKILGLILIFFTAGGSIGPVATGYLADRLGSYYYAFVPILAAAVLAVVTASGIKPAAPRTRVAAERPSA